MQRNINLPTGREFFWLIVVLFAASVLATGLVAVRFLWSWKFAHFYLVWNLFLAWIPLGFSILAWRNRDSRWRLIVCSALWLLFLPNAPYLVTDLVHLRERPPVPLWFDLVLLQSFIWLGLLLGFISLYKMQTLVARFSNRRISWLFVLAVVALTGFGIYLGRVQRWNSWDALLNPYDLVVDIFSQLFPPRRRLAGLFTILYSAFFFVAYLLLYGLTHLKLELKPIAQNENES